MYLSQTSVTTRKFDPSFAFELSPMGIAKQALKVLEFSNAMTYGDGFDFGNLSDDLEIHFRIVKTFTGFSS